MSRKKQDFGTLQVALKNFLKHIGLADSLSIQKQLKISQPVFSRLASTIRNDLLVIGRARATRYALRRFIDDVGASVPIYEILEDGSYREAALLCSIFPKGFFVESRVKDIPEGYYDDLPYFLDGLRPMGFLGRLIPRQHPELQLPSDIRDWSAEQCLRYLCRLGWNLSGNLLIGEEAKRLWEQNVQQPPDLVDSTQRESVYPAKAREAMSRGTPGSSAAGEHPKFLATRSSDIQPVLVKFELNTQTDAGRRSADLLVGEHIAHEVLAEHGQVATKSELVRGVGGELFLEMERFDRIGIRGRLGLITLQALDAQFVGRLLDWSDSARQLAALGHISKSLLRDIRWLELFGLFIGNTDMHLGNLSFVSSGARILRLAPVYDMLPMFYAPRELLSVQHEVIARTRQIPQGEFTTTLGPNSELEYISSELPDPEWVPPARASTNDDIWSSVVSSARAYWKKLSTHPDASRKFQSIAHGNFEKIKGL